MTLSKAKHAYGFSFLELTVVFSLVAILFAVALSEYRNRIGDSQTKTLSFQASTFLRGVENVRAISKIENKADVNMGGGITIYLNKWGWPVSSNQINISKSARYSVSEKGCESLWLAIFSGVTHNRDENHKKGTEHFEKLLINENVCRYRLSRKQEGLYFFDYDVRTGSVDVASQ